VSRRVVILGFMACGKTTVGQALARKLECNFIDLDSQISESEGRSPAQIIEANGEAAFREIETLALRDVLQNPVAGVIALGGGAWTIPANRTLVALHDCLTVWLDVPFELCWQRIIGSSSTMRPLAPDHTTAKKLYEIRQPSYQLAQLRVDAPAEKQPGKIVSEIEGASAR
jgi:shikimate kinase